MKLLRDLKIKHLSALVSQQVGKSVSIVAVSIDPFGPYFDVDEDGHRIKNSDYDRCVIAYCECGENFGRNMEVGFFHWNYEDEELIYEFEMDTDEHSDFFTYNWASLQDDLEDEYCVIAKYSDGDLMISKDGKHNFTYDEAKEIAEDHRQIEGADIVIVKANNIVMN